MYSKSLPYLLLLPATLFLFIFFLYPFTLVAWQAFTTDTGEFTSSFFQEMASHWKFNTALINTLLLALAVVPFQMALSIYMATLVNGMKRGRDIVLYIWTIPLGISDLAAGLIWLAIFEQSGFLNSMLHGLGVVEQPIGFLGYENKGIIFLAIVLAEIWRATSIVLVILVAGMGFANAQTQSADGHDPACHSGVRSICCGHSPGRDQSAGPHERGLYLAVRIA